MPSFVIPGLTRNPVFFCMVPGFRRDGVWIPALAGMTVRGLFTISTLMKAGPFYEF
jgi:hypothetical protein